MWYSKKKPLLWFLFALVVAVLGADLGEYGAARMGRLWVLSLISSFSVNIAAVLMLAIVGYDKMLEDIKRKENLQRLGTVEQFWRMPDVKSRSIVIVYGGNLGTFLDNTDVPTSLATVYGIHELKHFFESYWNCGDSVKVFSEDEFVQNRKECTRAHLILLGGAMSIKSKELSSVILALNVAQSGDDQHRQLIPTIQRDLTYPSHKNEKGDVEVDYGIVVGTIERESKRHFYWFSGNYGLATYAGILLATQERGDGTFKRLEEGKACKVVIEVCNIINSKLTRNHENISSIVRPENEPLDNFKLP